MGIELKLFWQGRLSLRALTWGVSQLPEGSRVRRHLGGPSAQWDRADYLSALTIDEIRFTNHLLMVDMWRDSDPKKRGEQPKLPEWVKRPWDAIEEEASVQEPTERKFASPTELRAFATAPKQIVIRHDEPGHICDICAEHMK